MWGDAFVSSRAREIGVWHLGSPGDRGMTHTVRGRVAGVRTTRRGDKRMTYMRRAPRPPVRPGPGPGGRGGRHAMASRLSFGELFGAEAGKSQRRCVPPTAGELFGAGARKSPNGGVAATPRRLPRCRQPLARFLIDAVRQRWRPSRSWTQHPPGRERDRRRREHRQRRRPAPPRPHAIRSPAARPRDRVALAAVHDVVGDRSGATEPQQLRTLRVEHPADHRLVLTRPVLVAIPSSVSPARAAR